jgi:NADH-quinone oxidoreductase subunit N
MTIFLAALAGIPPAGGWFAKFGLFRALLDAGGGWAAGLGVIVAINTVIAFAYYARVLMQMWFQPAPDDDDRPIVVTGALGAALVVTLVATIAFGVLPGLVGHFGDVSVLSALGG